MNARVIVTRPAADADAWVQPLRRAGFEVDALPLIDIVAAQADGSEAARQQAWRSLGDYAACFFVSGNAVSFFFASNQPLAQVFTACNAINNETLSRPVDLPLALRLLAPGPGTARALKAAGVPEAQIDTPPATARQFDSQTLWQQLAPRDWRGLRVLIVRGDSPPGRLMPDQTPDESADNSGASGRDWIARQWVNAGALVDFLVVYERRAPQWTAAQQARARAASADGSVWLFSSSEAVDNLLGLQALAGTSWRRARAVATHPRIAARVWAAGWGVVSTSRPALDDITRSIESIGHE